MTARQNLRVCFVIAPIGEEGSEVRRRSDQVLKHIIAPAANECDYEAIRADRISEPGMITSQVIQHILEDPLVIADLTGRNPNVFYELAIRHAVRKPVVQVIQIGEPIPFDVAQSRTIQVDHHDLDSVANCRDQLVKQIQLAERDPTNVDTPISVAVDLQSLRQSENPLEKSSAEIISMLQDLRSKVGEFTDMATPPRILPDMLSEMLFESAHNCSRLLSVLRLGEDETPSRAQFDEALAHAIRLERALRMLMRETGFQPGVMDDIGRRSVRTRRLPPSVPST